MLPSSHTSYPSFFPSPHVVAVHVLGAVPVHVKPVSTLQVDEQPSPRKLVKDKGYSPLAVLLSSHSSYPSFFPSPHVVAVHVLGPVPVHVKPVSTLQVDEQPSPRKLVKDKG